MTIENASDKHNGKPYEVTIRSHTSIDELKQEVRIENKRLSNIQICLFRYANQLELLLSVNIGFSIENLSFFFDFYLNL